MIPHRTPFFLPLLYPSLVWRMPTDRKELYLTFDDGPIPGPTEFVLEQLRQFSAKGTFFCIGDNVRKHPDIFNRIVSDGHTVGNHTFNHLSGWRTSNKEYINNIKKFEDQVTTINPQLTTKLFRPPYGRISRAQIAALTHYKIIMWDVLSIDYNKRLSPEACLRNTIKAVRPGSIIVFHDSLKAEPNLRIALPGLLNHFSSLGYTFKSLVP